MSATKDQEQIKGGKKGFIESLRSKRLICLDRAAIYEELIEELGEEFEDETPSRNGRQQSRNGRQDDEDEKITVNGEPDKRFKENETEKLSQSRHMVHGDDGRGEVKDPEHDRRLKENETDRLAKSRQNGDDGRGEVKDPENDLRLKQNLGKRAKANQD